MGAFLKYDNKQWLTDWLNVVFQFYEMPLY